MASEVSRCFHYVFLLVMLETTVEFLQSFKDPMYANMVSSLKKKRCLAVLVPIHGQGIGFYTFLNLSLQSGILFIVSFLPS